jgi:dipeptidyl aminopeptidase/acylaminoacyl peptidase
MRYKILLCCLVYTFLFTLPAVGQRLLTPESMLNIPRVSEPRVSPDGKLIAYTRKEVFVGENKTKSAIYIVPSSGGSPTRFSLPDENAYHPVWLSNSRLAFLSDKSGGVYNIWEMNLDGSNRYNLTNSVSSIGCFGYYNDGKKLWFSGSAIYDFMPDRVHRDLPFTHNARIYDNLMFRHWNSWSNGMFEQVWTAQIENGILLEAMNIMGGKRSHSPLQPFGGAEQIAVTPDNRFIAYTTKVDTGTKSATSTNADILVFDLQKFSTQNLTEENKGYDINPSFSPDGKYMMWLSMATPGYEADKNRLMLLDMVTGEKTELTSNFDNSVDMAIWDGDNSDRIFVIAGIQATHNIFEFSTVPGQRGRYKQITRDEADYQDIQIYRAGGKSMIYATRMSISEPTEIYQIDPDKGSVKRISFETSSSLKDLKMGRVEKRMIPTSDGKSMLTWVIYPPDFDENKKYPALLYCQGGPQSTVSQFFSYRWNFQLMAANGYIVVAPNRRGLPSFGQDWNAQISGDWGGQAMNDLLSAIDAVKTEKFVDENRLGAVGASFGGYSVYWLAGHHQKRFKAFVSHCGVFNLESMYGSTEELFFVNHDLGGAYFDQPRPKSYDLFSPHKFVDKWDTPILVIHNEMDFRVPLTQGIEAFTAAQLKGVPSRFLYFPDEGHWVNKPQNSILWQRTFFDWLNTHLK